jgi:HEAT repeat protein
MERPTYLQSLLRELDAEKAQPLAAAEPAKAISLIEALAPLPMPAAYHAAGALLELGTGAAPALKRWILAHGDHSVLWALLNEEVDAGPGLEAFGELLDEDDPDFVAAAAAAVGKCGAPGLRYAERLRELAETGGDSWVRSHALRALGQVGAQETALLIKAVREGDEDENLAAVAALGLLGPDAREAVDAICDCLEHDSPLNAQAAATALMRIGERSPRVGDALAAALARTDDPDRYENLLHAIGRLGAPSPAAQAALDEAIRSEDAAKRGAAAVAAHLATGDPAGVRVHLADAAWFLREWQVDPGPFADALLQSLEERAGEGPPAGMDDLQELLRKATAGMKPERLMMGDDVVEVMSTEIDPSATIVADVADALVVLAQRLGDPAAIPALERIAADQRSRPWTQDMAAEASKALRGKPDG